MLLGSKVDLGRVQLFALVLCLGLGILQTGLCTFAPLLRIFELTEKFKESGKQHKSAEAGLKNAETQAEDQRQKLYVTETSLATEQQNVLDLKAALQKAQDEMRRVKEEAQLI